MYKVFMNDKPIIITDSSEQINNFEVYKFDKINFLELFKKMNSPSVNGICLLSANLFRDWLSFQMNFKVIEAAGGKVMNTSNEILFIYRFDTWDLPKGHIEKGEAKEVAAMREVEEECGIQDLHIEKQLETTYHIFYFKEQLRLKVTYWFLMKTNFRGKLVPQLEEGITEVAFKNKNEIENVLKHTYSNIKLLF